MCPPPVPRRSRRRSRGRRRISTCPRCSGRWHTRTRSPSRAGVLGTEHRVCPQRGDSCEGRGCPWGEHRLTRTHHGWHWGQGVQAELWYPVVPSGTSFPLQGFQQPDGVLGGTVATQPGCPPGHSSPQGSTSPIDAHPGCPARQEELQQIPGRASAPSPPHRTWGQTPAHSSLAQPVPNPGGWHMAQPGMALGTLPLPTALGYWGTGTLWSQHRTVGEEGNRGCPGGAGRVMVGMGFGAKAKPCTGWTLPGCGSVEGDAGADAQ